MTQMNVWFSEVPPPATPPIHEDSAALGLLSCLNVDDNKRQFRCAQCKQMSPGGPMAWVPDGIRVGDPEWSIAETCRRNAYNGHASAWCLSCARKLSRKAAVKTAPKININAVANATQKARPWWDFFWPA